MSPTFVGVDQRFGDRCDVKTQARVVAAFSCGRLHCGAAIGERKYRRRGPGEGLSRLPPRTTPSRA
jgi:hypothetical protein